uniref:Uncharacterized protein n=1 Tax=Romanomermis culicivorax TaxID=13658 RepID=A0A915KP97_ROMCU
MNRLIQISHLTSKSDLDIDGRPRDVNKAMQKGGLYKKCQECSLLNTYQKEEMEKLELVHEQTTSKQYRNIMSNVIKFRCSKKRLMKQ